MEKKSLTPTLWAMNAGAIVGFIMAACDCISYWSLKNNFSFGSVFSMFTYVVFITGIFYSQRLYRDRTGGYIAYDKALIIGFLTSFYTSIIVGFYYFLLNKFDPAVMDRLIESASKTYENNTSILNQLNESKDLLTPVTMAISVVFSNSVIGLLISFISSFMVKKNGPAEMEGPNKTDN